MTGVTAGAKITASAAAGAERAGRIRADLGGWAIGEVGGMVRPSFAGGSAGSPEGGF